MNRVPTSVRRLAGLHSLLKNPLRALLARSHARLFHAVEGGSLVVNLPDFLGSFEIDCHSDVLRRVLIDGQYERELVKAVRCGIDPYRDAIDVGANVGLFSVLMSGLLAASGRVLAIEPTPGAIHYLHRNLERNRCSANVLVYEGVAARTAGDFSINVIPGMEEYSSIADLVHPSAIGKAKKQVGVAGDTIDHLVERFALRPGFLKIDTEGAEFEVLTGARQTIAEHRPVIVCESWPDDLVRAAGGTPGAVAGLLRGYGYEIFDHAGEMIAFPPDADRSHNPEFAGTAAHGQRLS